MLKNHKQMEDRKLFNCNKRFTKKEVLQGYLLSAIGFFSSSSLSSWGEKQIAQLNFVAVSTDIQKQKRQEVSILNFVTAVLIKILTIRATVAGKDSIPSQKKKGQE